MIKQSLTISLNERQKKVDETSEKNKIGMGHVTESVHFQMVSEKSGQNLPVVARAVAPTQTVAVGGVAVVVPAVAVVA